MDDQISRALVAAAAHANQQAQLAVESWERVSAKADADIDAINSKVAEAARIRDDAQAAALAATGALDEHLQARRERLDAPTDLGGDLSAGAAGGAFNASVRIDENPVDNSDVDDSREG